MGPSLGSPARLAWGGGEDAAGVRNPRVRSAAIGFSARGFGVLQAR